MEDKCISDFKETQHDLLMEIKRCIGQINAGSLDIFPKSKRFLDNQKQQLKFLAEKRRVHMFEKGKVMFKLVAQEQVTLSYLKEIYTVFVKPLDNFIQIMFKLTTRCGAALASKLEPLKQEALDIAKEMLEISLVLESQPDNTNYDKNKNPVPNLLCLGAQCLSEFSFKHEDCHLAGVMESDLCKAGKDDKPLDSVKGFKGFTVAPKQTKGAKSSASTSHNKDCISISLGTWSIPKDQLSASEKGNAHKDWVRLKYNVQVKLHGTVRNLWLLSLPFNIRKGSIQLYTFTGAFMWYYHNTANPYKDFTIPVRLPTGTVLDMLIKRLEVIGRKLSDDAKDFFARRLECLSSNGKVELETVTKGPPSSKNRQQPESNPSVDSTLTVDEAIGLYGFFTWFYALVTTLDTNGYMNKAWLKGYIYDICEHEYMEKMVKQPTFGPQTAALRPSLSKIENYQGKDINMGMVSCFKTLDHPGKVFTIQLFMEDIKEFGLAENLTYAKFIWMKDGYANSIEQAPPEAAKGEINQYHTTQSRRTGGPKLVDSDGMHAKCTCQCHHNALPDGKSELKKPRNYSGNSEGISSMADSDSDSLFHKRGGFQKACSPLGNLVTSSGDATPSSQWSSSWDKSHDSPDSGMGCHMSPTDENRGPVIPQFDLIFPGQQAPCVVSDGNRSVPSSSPIPTNCSSSNNRERLMTSFQEAFQNVSSRCNDEVIEELTKAMWGFLATENSSQASSSPPEQMAVERQDLVDPLFYNNGNLNTDLAMGRTQFVLVSTDGGDGNNFFGDGLLSNTVNYNGTDNQYFQVPSDTLSTVENWADLGLMNTTLASSSTPSISNNYNNNNNNNQKCISDEDYLFEDALTMRLEYEKKENKQNDTNGFFA